MLTKGQLRALDLLIHGKDHEIVCEGREAWIDSTRISLRTVNGLLAHMAIKDAGYAGVGCHIYCPTETSTAILKRPALADEMVERVVRNKPFFIGANGVIRDA